MSDFSIRDILNQVSKGNLRIPAFQRGFVWDADSVAFLMDSIYKGYPFGTIQLWRTKEKLKIEKQFGPFKLFERDEEYPIDYVLDGQQRVTSIFGAFQTEIDEADAIENPFKIYYDLNADENSQDSQFIPLKDEEVFPDRHFPLNCLFDTVRYRRATKALDEAIVERIDDLQATWGLFQKWPPVFLQSGHIFRSKVSTPFRLKVCSRLILRRFEVPGMPYGLIDRIMSRNEILAPVSA